MGTHTHSKTHHYAAFISYAHADEAMAARLHKALETYPVPRHLRVQGKTTKPVFRDVAELTAAHSLSEKIQQAVRGSRVLIVLCSPAAKASHWVNEEIRLFRKLHGDAAILSAIIEGTPETAFPDTLTEGGREPLAAALGTDKPGFRLGVTQLAAGMLGTGLDDLVQRGARRRQKIMGAGLAASLVLSGIMGFTAYQAVEARNEAEIARGDAEGLVEYMIKDLKFKLEPVGRLDLLEGIGDKAVEYYDKQDIKQLPDDSLTRQAAARQVLAQVHLDAGRMDEAQREIEAAAALTREVLARNPEDTDAIFAHAQSEYWVGAYYRQQKKFSEMEKPWREYDRLAQILYEKNSSDFDWVMEAGWGKNNLGIWARESQDLALINDAKNHYQDAIRYFKEALMLNPHSTLANDELANSLSGLGFTLLVNGHAQEARYVKEEEITLRKQLIKKHPQNLKFKIDEIITLLDFHNLYFLPINKNQVVDVRRVFDEFFSLIKLDKKNYKNVRLFLRLAMENIEHLNLESLKDRQEKVRYILELFHQSDDEFLFSLELIIALNDVKIKCMQGAIGSAKDDLISLNALIFDSAQSDMLHRFVYLSAFYRNRELGLYTDSKLHAENFLIKLDNKMHDVRYPTISWHKILAYKTLGTCDRIKPLANDLLARGYLSDHERQNIKCP